MPSLEEIIGSQKRPALLIGNGINRYNNPAKSSWDELLSKLAANQGLDLTEAEASEMSNTEFFDVLDLARPKSDRSSLQQEFCGLMEDWAPTQHHQAIVEWARRKNSPIVTVNFDENLSRSVDAKFFRGHGFTDYYPWSSYFSDREILDPRSEFAIWHAHGMMRYFRSIQLGLTNYMGSVEKARKTLYGRQGLRANARGKGDSWAGAGTWLEVFFFCPLLIVGFGFGKDENFLRWLFLERARVHKLNSHWKEESWFVDTGSSDRQHRRPFFESLGIEIVSLPDYSEIYESRLWTL